MTVETKQYLKSTWMTFANFILLLGVAYKVGVAQTELDKNIKYNTNEINNNKIDIHENSTRLKDHALDTKDHKPMDRLMTTFVPREEIDSRLENIEKGQNEIKQLIRDIK